MLRIPTSEEIQVAAWSHLSDAAIARRLGRPKGEIGELRRRAENVDWFQHDARR